MFYPYNEFRAFLSLEIHKINHISVGQCCNPQQFIYEKLVYINKNRSNELANECLLDVNPMENMWVFLSNQVYAENRHFDDTSSLKTQILGRMGKYKPKIWLEECKIYFFLNVYTYAYISLYMKQKNSQILFEEVPQ